MRFVLVALGLLAVAPWPAPTARASDGDKRVAWRFTLDIADAYVFRGFVEEDEGVVIQPGLEAYIGLYRPAAFVKSLDLLLGQWSSVHTGPTGDPVGVGPKGWYEHDFDVGLALGFGTASELATRLWAYTSPNGNFPTQWEWETWLSIDDSAFWRDVGWRLFDGIYPYAVLGVELDGTSTGDQEGIYGELGMTPRFDLVESKALTFAIQLPLALGFGLDDTYFEVDDGTPGDLLGCIQVGIQARALIHAIPETHGIWQVLFGGKLYVLGTEAAKVSGHDQLLVFMGSLVVDL